MKRRLAAALALSALFLSAAALFAAASGSGAVCKMGKICPLRGLRGGAAAPCTSPDGQLSLPMPCCERLPAAPAAPGPQLGAPAALEFASLPALPREAAAPALAAGAASGCPHHDRLAERGLHVVHSVFRI